MKLGRREAIPFDIILGSFLFDCEYCLLIWARSRIRSKNVQPGASYCPHRIHLHFNSSVISISCAAVLLMHGDYMTVN
jgi:hypothetical protein